MPGKVPLALFNLGRAEGGHRREIAADTAQESVEVEIAGVRRHHVQAHLFPPGTNGRKAGAGNGTLGATELDGAVIAPVLDVDFATLAAAALLDFVGDLVEGALVAGQLTQEVMAREEITHSRLGTANVGVAVLAAADLPVDGLSKLVVLDVVGVEGDELREVLLTLGLGGRRIVLNDMDV